MDDETIAVAVPPEWRMADPEPSRPQLPPTYQVAPTLDGIGEWRGVQARLATAHIYWIATTRPDGRPHITPVWGVWLCNHLFFDGHPETRRGRNLALNPDVAVHLESADAGKDVVILEGLASRIMAPERRLTEVVAAAYTHKYVAEGYAPDPDAWAGGDLYAVRPHSVFSWGAHLGNTATRWRFPERETGA